MTLQKRLTTPHAVALLTLLSAWGLFFWRLWTPIENDQLSFVEGDFSAQFVAWTDYAVERLKAGELPLWNPYQYGGAPFQASPQTQLTYPPHMLTLASLLVQNQVDRWEVYAAMQREVMLHVLLVSLLIYYFTRRLLAENPEMSAAQTSFGGLAAALTYTYGGYAAGYPILQAPLLAAGVWLPLILLGILEATCPERPRMAWGWLLFSGVMFGICLLAGHPQTAWFSFYMAAGWLGYRLWLRRWSVRLWVIGVLALGAFGAALAAVQLLPTIEFTAHTYRLDLTFAAKGGGYSFEELVNILFPVRGQIWNSNHFGIATLPLAGIAVWRRVRGWGFFAAAFGIAFLLAFGGRTPLYGMLYPLLPALSLFRGQERAAFLMAHSFALLVGLGAAHVLSWSGWRERPHTRTLRRTLSGLLILSAAYTSILYFLAQTSQRSETLIGRMNGGALTCLILAAMLLGLGWFLRKPNGAAQRAALIGLLIFDLFSTTAMLEQNYQPIPLKQRLLTPPYVVEMQNGLGSGDRLDSGGSFERGYGTLYRLLDIQGSDPLQLEALHVYLEEISLPRRWELLGVRVVAGGVGGEYFPVPGEVPAQPIGASLVGGVVQFPIWGFDNPRGFARLMYQVTQVRTPEEAFGLVREPAFDLRNIIILEENPLPETLDSLPSLPEKVTLTRFEPEDIRLEVTAPRAAVLSLALPYFPGWEAKVDGSAAEVLRAYGGLSAVYLPAGEHQVALRYRSRWLEWGTLISAAAWLGGLLVMGGLWRRRNLTR